MKVLLTAVNAKYIHSNPAIYGLRSYASAYREQIDLAEFTINQNLDEILRSIYEKKPDVLAISCYIWNRNMVDEIVKEYKKIDPVVPIWVGGPEVSYDAQTCLEHLPELTGVMIGEGEQTFLELIEYYMNHEKEDVTELHNIAGIAYRGEEDKIFTTKARNPIDFSSLPFLYEYHKDLSILKNRIIYYETSRGCPFSCSYCLSSIDKRVRFRKLSLVYEELQLFLDLKVPQVKFIDRTFNCKKDHALSILRYIKEHDNMVTNFHFEIAADILDQEEIEFLTTLRPGLVQLEIGVQSTNPETIHAIHRHMNLDLVAANVAAVRKARNIHQHLDLIAGLPFEDYRTFQKSFDDVYAMRPDQLQLGFLKVLKGSYMGEMSQSYEIVYHSNPPYEVMYTKWLSYADVGRLKDLEDMVEVYYNSGQFSFTMEYLTHFYDSSFSLYEELGAYYRAHGLFGSKQSRIQRYTILRDAMKAANRTGLNLDLLCELMIFDLYLREKLKTRPEFAKSFENDKSDYKEFLTNRAGDYGIGEQVHIEHFHYDILEAARSGRELATELFILFDYDKGRDIFNQVSYCILTKQQGKLEPVIQR